MSAPAPDTLAFAAIPCLILAALGIGFTLAARPLLEFQIRMMEWQLNWLRGGAGLFLFRAIGVLLVLMALAVFLIFVLAGGGK